MSWRFGHRVDLTLFFEPNGLRITPSLAPTNASWFLEGEELLDAKNDGWTGGTAGFLTGS